MESDIIEKQTWNINESENTWSLYSLVVIGVDADFVALLRKGVLAVFNGSELVMRLEIGPAPQTTIDHVRQAFAAYTLHTVVANASWTRPSKARHPKQQSKTSLDYFYCTRRPSTH